MNSSSGRGVLSPVSSARSPVGCTVTGMREDGSVSSTTRLVERPTPAIRPARPSPSIVAQPSTTPSCAPTFSRTDCRNAVPLSISTIPVSPVSEGSMRTLFSASSLEFSCSSWTAASFQADMRCNSRRNSWFCS